jgi:Tfp pilus assembly protein PilO
MEGWHLDKKVPIAIMVAFAIQTCTLIGIGAYWVSTTNSRLAQLEQHDQQIMETHTIEFQRVNKLEGIVQVLVAQRTDMNTRFDRLEDKLDRIIERTDP